MNDKTKERIVGVLILVCLAVIFIPPFYDGRNPFDLDVDLPSKVVPKPPQFPDSATMANNLAPIGSSRLAEIEQKVKQANPPSAVSDSQLEVQESSFYRRTLNELSAGEMTSKLLGERFADKNAMKQAWAVQVGSFKEAERAQKVRDQLIAEGFQAYIKTVMHQSETTSRVFAGVTLDKDMAERIKTHVEEKLSGHTAIVVPYQP